jgi:hypothetical protein
MKFGLRYASLGRHARGPAAEAAGFDSTTPSATARR